MQRFAIKIDKSVKARLKNLCRLCGIDNPNQIDILNAAEWIDLTIDGEVSISRKIEECVGVKVCSHNVFVCLMNFIFKMLFTIIP